MPAALYLLQRDGQFLTGHDLFLKRVGASFHAFIEVRGSWLHVRMVQHMHDTVVLMSDCAWRKRCHPKPHA